MIHEIENEPSKMRIIDSILVKLAIIALLILALLIPSSWIQSLITDRMNSQQSAINDISDKWSGSQLIQGPVLVIPYKKMVKQLDDKKKEVTTEVTETLYVLPENLKIKANVQPDILHRGMYEAVVYNSQLTLNGSFNKLDAAKLGIDANAIQYDKVRLIFSVSDLKGLKSNPVIQLQDQKFTAEPVYGANSPFNKGLQVSFALPKDADLNFSFNLDLKGSDDLSFLHTGKTTDVEVNSTWSSPSFEGRYLPDTRDINKNGFHAKWRMLYYNRPFPQHWINDDTILTSNKAQQEAVFGVKLRLPVDQYQKTMRTTKYSSLIIMLTFISLFFTELIRKQRIHVFNYVLIGAAMVIYYTLLLSFSEQIGYTNAYLTASVATILLVAIFTGSLLKNKPAALVFGSILSTFYGFVYVLIQLEDLSLLIGSVALFIVIALLMYFSRKINWEKH